MWDKVIPESFVNSSGHCWIYFQKDRHSMVNSTGIERNTVKIMNIREILIYIFVAFIHFEIYVYIFQLIINLIHFVIYINLYVP
jgi:hypothetical protein